MEKNMTLDQRTRQVQNNVSLTKGVMKGLTCLIKESQSVTYLHREFGDLGLKSKELLVMGFLVRK